MDDDIMEQKLKSAGCRIHDRVIRMIEGDMFKFAFIWNTNLKSMNIKTK